MPRLTARRLALLAGALLTVPAVILIEHSWRSGPLHPGSIAAGSAILAVLVVVRFAGLVHAVEGARAAERAANERLRELDRLKDEFISTVSHELRTPLTSITGYIELAREEANAESARFLEIAERNAARLLALVNDLLLVARIQGGRLEIEAERVDVREVAAESVASAGPHAARRSVVLDVHAETAESAVLGDRRRLGQVLDNLISNAIKFSPDGGRVGVAVAGRNGAVLVEVSDQGLGMSDEECNRLFERFFRTRGAHERQIQGTGLGLYITRAIVEAHGGTIGVRSVQGQGSTFAVELPAAR